jgi:hypothetical protein
MRSEQPALPQSSGRKSTDAPVSGPSWKPTVMISGTFGGHILQHPGSNTPDRRAHVAAYASAAFVRQFTEAVSFRGRGAGSR